jgi:hypothetical protein
MNRVLATAITLFLVALPVTAFGRPKVALAPLDGDTSGDVMDAVADALDAGEVTLITPKQFSRALDKLGLDAGELKDRDLKKLAGELEADALVQTSLSSKGSHKVLHFKLFVHNKKQKGFKVEFANVKSPKFKQMLHDRMLEGIGVESSGNAGAGDDDKAADKATDKPSKRKKKDKGRGGDDDAAAGAGGDDDKPADKARPSKKKGGDDEVAKKKGGDDEAAKRKGGDDEVADKAASGDDDDRPAKKHKKDEDAPSSDDDHPRKASKRTASSDDDSEELHGGVDVDRATTARPVNRYAVRLDAGLSMTSRNLTFNSRPNLSNPPPGYKNGVVPGARIEASFYPLALSSPTSVAAGLGLAASYDKTISLSLKNSAQPGTTFAANEQHYAVGPRFRYVFGDSVTSSSLTIGVDYGHRMFKIDRSALMPGNVIDVPDVDYRGFTPSVEFRLPVTTAIALFVGGGSLLVTGTGSIQSNSQYGKARVTEGEGHAGVDVVFAKRFAVRLSAEFAQIGFSFTGTGQQAINRDMDPSSVDVGGAADRYFGGAATFSVLY